MVGKDFLFKEISKHFFDLEQRATQQVKFLEVLHIVGCNKVLLPDPN